MADGTNGAVAIGAPTVECVHAVVRDGSLGEGALVALDGRGELRAVRREGLAAAVSTVAAELLTGLEDDPARLALLVRRHDEVVRRLFRQRPVLPMRFGTVLATEDAVARFLEERRADLLRELERLEGTAEWRCKLRRLDGPTPTTGAADADTDPPVVTGGGEGTAYLARLAHRRRENAAQSHRAADAAASVVAYLASESVDVQRVESIESGCILNAVFLVATRAQEAFTDAVCRATASAAAAGLQVDVDGPLPPYHFVDVGDSR